MKQHYFLLLGCLILSTGCATIPSGIPEHVEPVVLPVDVPYRVRLGMDSAEVQAVIGPKVVVGYEIGADGTTQPIEEDSLCGTEIVTINGQVYQVDEYVVPVEASAISGKERTTLVFKDGVLVARGEAEFKALQQAAGQ